MKIVDYTELPLGTKIDDGEIYLCPHCGKSGLAEKVYDQTYFTHLLEWQFNERGPSP